jgi:hypothetical protein
MTEFENSDNNAESSREQQPTSSTTASRLMASLNRLGERHGGTNCSRGTLDKALIKRICDAHRYYLAL